MLLFQDSRNFINTLLRMAVIGIHRKRPVVSISRLLIFFCREQFICLLYQLIQPVSQRLLHFTGNHQQAQQIINFRNAVFRILLLGKYFACCLISVKRLQKLLFFVLILCFLNELVIFFPQFGKFSFCQSGQIIGFPADKLRLKDCLIYQVLDLRFVIIQIGNKIIHAFAVVKLHHRIF